MSLSFLPYAKQSINLDDIQAMNKALHGEVITRGSYVEAFEKAVANYTGARHAVAFNSASSALAASYFAAQVTSFDRVISTPNTFIATVGAAMAKKAAIRLVDIDRKTGNLDLLHLTKELDFSSTRGRLILCPVHFAGIAMDMKQLDQLVRDPYSIIIEDAAHALGSSYPTGEKVGCCLWSHMTVFSFHPAKNMTTGEGGMVVTNDDELLHRLQLYRNNGIEREAPYLEQPPALGYYEVHALTGNYNFTDFQAALGLSQLQRLDAFVAKRRSLMQIYREQLEGTAGITLFSDSQDALTAFHLCVVQIDHAFYKMSKVDIMQALKKEKIGSQVHYIPLYNHPVFKNIFEERGNYFPEMETYYDQALSLPLYYDLKPQEVIRVCKTLKKILAVS